MIKSDFLYGKLKYRTENQLKEPDFENYMALILSSVEQKVTEDTVGR